MPNFSFRTPLHYLLLSGEFELFNITAKLVQNKNNKNLFNDVCINKIIDMLINIFQNVSSYTCNALEDIHCKLECSEEGVLILTEDNHWISLKIRELNSKCWHFCFSGLFKNIMFNKWLEFN